MYHHRWRCSYVEWSSNLIVKNFSYGGSFNDHASPAWTEDHVVVCAVAGCRNSVRRGDAFSFYFTFATRGTDKRAGGFQCPDGEEISKSNLHAQHFCCSEKCMITAMHACIDEHLLPRHHAHMAFLSRMDAEAEAERQAFAELVAKEDAERQKTRKPEEQGNVS